MNFKDVLEKASSEIISLKGQTLDVLDVKKPHSLAYAKHLAKVISKISPLIGNMIEYSIIEILNQHDWEDLGSWVRQDPGFPDALFSGNT